jgi:hypothetical protein
MLAVRNTPNYTLTTRPHIGCGVGRTIYEIRDADTGQIVRTQITPPTDEDCATAVRNVRSGKNAWGVPSVTAPVPRKRVDLKL